MLSITKHQLKIKDLKQTGRLNSREVSSPQFGLQIQQSRSKSKQDFPLEIGKQFPNAEWQRSRTAKVGSTKAQS